MSEDKSSKSNGLGPDPMQRLASLKAPRDLMLGGVKPNKKVYIPNLNVTRNKNKGPSTANTRDQKKDDKGSRDRKNDRNKNFKNGPKVIKSSGVFSEGLGNSERHSSRVSYGRDSGGTTTVMQKPTIRVKDVIKIDKELEEQKIKTVLGETGNTADDESVDFKEIHEMDAPIKLPMDDGGWLNTQAKHKIKVKQEIIVKKEPDVESDCMLMDTEDVEKKPIPDVKEVFENTDVVNLLKSDKSTLILLQLPDSLPGRGGSVEDEAPRRKPFNNPAEPSTSGNEEKKEDKPSDTMCYLNNVSAVPKFLIIHRMSKMSETCASFSRRIIYCFYDMANKDKVDNKCLLSDLEEGRIGKLMIHRSGRVSLALGDTIFEVSMGTKAAFHQEVVSVACDDTSRSASLIDLGPLHHKLNILPDWEAMFRDMPV